MFNKAIRCLKTCDTNFDDIIITFTNQNDRTLETGDKFNMKLFFNEKNDTLFYATKNKNIC